MELLPFRRFMLVALLLLLAATFVQAVYRPCSITSRITVGFNVISDDAVPVNSNECEDMLSRLPSSASAPSQRESDNNGPSSGPADLDVHHDLPISISNDVLTSSTSDASDNAVSLLSLPNPHQTPVMNEHESIVGNELNGTDAHNSAPLAIHSRSARFEEDIVLTPSNLSPTNRDDFLGDGLMFALDLDIFESEESESAETWKCSAPSSQYVVQDEPNDDTAETTISEVPNKRKSALFFVASSRSSSDDDVPLYSSTDMVPKMTHTHTHTHTHTLMAHGR